MHTQAYIHTYVNKRPHTVFVVDDGCLQFINMFFLPLNLHKSTKPDVHISVHMYMQICFSAHNEL